MIQPNEKLLPGNVVMYHGPYKNDVVTILTIQNICEIYKGYDFAEDYSPTPLTPEILVQWCEFDKDKFYYFKASAKGLVFYFDFDDKVLMIADTKSLGGAISIHIPEHLHTLQNLIYFLSGEEMPVNIPNH